MHCGWAMQAPCGIVVDMLLTAYNAGQGNLVFVVRQKQGVDYL